MSDAFRLTYATMFEAGVGDPTRREHWRGPVLDAGAMARCEDPVAQLAGARGGGIVEGGLRRDHGDLAHGHFVAATIARAPHDPALWSAGLFAPIVLLRAVDNLDEAFASANASDSGLTAGFYGSDDETVALFDAIEAGVSYANRPQGATTGAWPG